MVDVIVMKFGGSCLTSPSSINNILNIIQQYKSNELILIASALSGITDLLINSAKKADKKENYNEIINSIKKKHIEIIELLKNPIYMEMAENHLTDHLDDLIEMLKEIEMFGLTPYKLDYVMSKGEKLSSFILMCFLKDEGYEADYISADKLIFTDNVYQNALPIMDATREIIESRIKLNRTIYCITGFIGRNIEGHTTTLGRGGSDFTATIIANCLHNPPEINVKVILWKDVPGLLTAHPKIEPDAVLVQNLSYNEAKELAYFGSKILHPKCVIPIQEKEIPLEIKNFNDPTSMNCTIISSITQNKEITGISVFTKVCMVTALSTGTIQIPGVLAKLFSLMGANNINVMMVSQSSSEINTTFTVNKEDGIRAKQIIEESNFFKKWFKVSVQDVGMIAIIGLNLNKPKIIGRIFNALSKKNIQINALAQGSNGLNISILIPHENLEDAVRLIHKEFIHF
ncbi:MAG: aspartate kinase [Candidatus Helarchaeota archaeon]